MTPDFRALVDGSSADVRPLPPPAVTVTVPPVTTRSVVASTPSPPLVSVVVPPKTRTKPRSASVVLSALSPCPMTSQPSRRAASKKGRYAGPLPSSTTSTPASGAAARREPTSVTSFSSGS
jgi:hypothetical protein